MISKHDIAEANEKIQNELLILLDGLTWTVQTAACQIVVDGLKTLKEKAVD